MNIFSAPYLVRIIVSLAGILVFQKITKSLSAALALGAVILALWTGHSPVSLAAVTGERLLSLDTLFLALVIAGVIWLSSLMSEAGMMKDLVASLKPKLSQRGIFAALPAVVGLLPMPAGALFSAPLLDDADEARNIDPLRKTRVNYWFRHIWEFWWPLYPGVLLAVDLTGLPIWKLAGLMFPLCFAAGGAGWIFLLRGVSSEKRKAAVPPPPNASKEPDSFRDRNDRDAKISADAGAATGRDAGTGASAAPAFFPLVLPTVTVIGVYGILLAAAPALGRANRYLPMALGILCGLIVLQFQRPSGAAVWKKVLLSKRTLSLVLIVVLARIYGAFIETRLPGGSFIMQHIKVELDAFGIPALLLVIIIPFVSGLSAGITVGYIGASFPVVVSLAGSGAAFYSTIILGYTSGFLGMMLSPIHVCLIVTNEYYTTSTFKTLAGLWKPVLFVFACAALYAFLWTAFG